MDFKEYQNKSHGSAIYLNKFKEAGYEEIPSTVIKFLELCYCSNGLGEVGEIQGKIKKIFRDQAGEIKDSNIQDLKKELGDVLWYVAEMCTVLDLDMGEVAEQNIKKLYDRKNRGVLTGSGDNR